jgi:murein DD-endopeptidase MepM/ murein hydrolase activator NlpD
MRHASKAWAGWGIAAALLLATGSIFATAVPAAAQTQPTPNPLESLIPNLLAPLLPILAPPTAQPPGNNAPSKATQVPAPAPPPLPPNPEVHCGGVPAPLSFNRGYGRTTQDLVEVAKKHMVPGQSIQVVMTRIAPPFPVAGPAHYRDDWGEPRWTPCPHLHQGNDIFADFGTPFVAPEGGVVTGYGYEGVGGNSVYFLGDDGFGFYGAHLQGFGPGLRYGQHVDAGTILGYVGNTGDAAGGSPHLHFQLYPKGRGFGSPVDPKFWLDASLNSAILHAGGVITGPGGSGAGQPINFGGLVGSVLVAGGHIVSQPTVPVILVVLLVIAGLAMAQTRTFKVAVELRRSRSEAAVPAYLVSGMTSIAAGGAALVKVKRRRLRPVGGRPAPEPDRPVWASAAVAHAASNQKKPSRFSLVARSVGQGWENFPTKLSRISSPGANGSNGNGNGHSSNGHRSNGNGSNGNGNHASLGPTRAWTPASPAATSFRPVHRSSRKSSGTTTWTPGSTSRR